MIAVDEINKSGGLLGRKIEVVFYDDKNDLENAKSLKETFKEDGVKLVSGFHISQMKDAANYIMENNDDILFVSPTMNSHTLIGIEDNLILMMSSANEQIPTIVNTMKRNKTRNLLILYDPNNMGFSMPYAESLKKFAYENGINVFTPMEFNLEKHENEELIENIKNINPDAIYFVSNSIDTPQLSQIIRNAGIKSTFYAPSWADKISLIEHGGSSTNGMYITGYFDKFNKSTEYQLFEKKFIKRYGYNPSYSSMFGYHSMQVIAEGIKKSSSSSPQKVKQAIIEIERFIGLQGNYNINKYGDATGDVFLYKILNGKYQLAN